MSTAYEPDDAASRLARLEERVQGMREATAVAKQEVDRRLDDMNELRHQIEGERGRYLTIDRYDERHRALETRMGLAENRLSTLEGGNQIRASTVGWAIAGLGLFITIVVIAVNVVTSGSP